MTTPTKGSGFLDGIADLLDGVADVVNGDIFDVPAAIIPTTKPEPTDNEPDAPAAPAVKLRAPGGTFKAVPKPAEQPPAPETER